MVRGSGCAPHSPLKVPPLPLVEATPDAVRLLGDDRVRQALQTNHAGAADGSGFTRRSVAGWEEDFRFGSCAVAVGAPSPTSDGGGLSKQNGWKMYVVYGYFGLVRHTQSLPFPWDGERCPGRSAAGAGLVAHLPLGCECSVEGYYRPRCT